MLRDRFAVFAVDAVGIQAVFEPFQTGRIVWELGVKVFLRVAVHLGLAVHTLPYPQAECSKSLRIVKG